jgi:hypothetical protein
MKRDEKLKTFKWIKLKHSIRFVYLNIPLEIDSFKNFYFQNQYFLDGMTPSEIHQEFIHYQFIQLCKKWLVYPYITKKEILDFYEKEMDLLLRDND